MPSYGHPRLWRGWLLCLLLWLPTAWAQPFTPDSDDTVLLAIPATAKSLRRGASKIVPEVQARPMARLLLEQYRQAMNPRTLGRAQALLQPWLGAPNPNPATLLLGAQLAQANHDFAAAESLLQQVLQQQRDSAQAWLELVNLQRVGGRYPEAQSSCGEFAQHSSAFAASLCMASIESLQDDLEQGWQALQLLQPALAAQPLNMQLWYWQEWVELAQRRNDQQALAGVWAQLQRRHGADLQIQAQYLDWLLSQQQWRKVVALTEDSLASPVFMVPRYMALHQLGDPRALKLADEIEQLWTALKTRPASQSHGREQARYWLLRNQPVQALKLAQEHWQTQREPQDTLILAQAAVAAADQPAQEQLRAWLAQSGYRDRRLPAEVLP